MVDDPQPLLRLPRDGRTWRVGTSAEVAWIAEATEVGVRITSAIPPCFAAYATVVVPEPTGERDEHDRALLALLVERSGDQPWWLGYLETGPPKPHPPKSVRTGPDGYALSVGGVDVVFPDAPRVQLYAGWSYVLVEAGPQQAATWRTNDWHTLRALPDLMFPADRSWLVSRLWDDDWRCIGGPGELVAQLLRDPQLEARSVQPGDDATPPGHVSR